jgi:hypothetical protein
MYATGLADNRFGGTETQSVAPAIHIDRFSNIQKLHLKFPKLIPNVYNEVFYNLARNQLQIPAFLPRQK